SVTLNRLWKGECELRGLLKGDRRDRRSIRPPVDECAGYAPCGLNQYPPFLLRETERREDALKRRPISSVGLDCDSSGSYAGSVISHCSQSDVDGSLLNVGQRKNRIMLAAGSKERKCAGTKSLGQSE